MNMARSLKFCMAFVCVAAGGGIAAVGQAQDQAATRPATQPATQPAPPADDVLDRLLEPETRPAPAGERPGEADRFAGAMNNASGRGSAAVAPETPRVPLVPEGTYVVDRLGRVRQSVDSRGLEFVFAADGTVPEAAGDPPMLLAPNLNLMVVERSVREEPEVRFRVTGRVTEYRGRNYLLLDKVVVVR